MNDPASDVSMRPSGKGALTSLGIAVILGAGSLWNSYSKHPSNHALGWAFVVVIVGGTAVVVLLFLWKARVRLAGDEVVVSNLIGARRVIPRQSISTVLKIDSLDKQMYVVGLGDDGHALFRLSDQQWKSADLDDLTFEFGDLVTEIEAATTVADVTREYPFALSIWTRRRYLAPLIGLAAILIYVLVVNPFDIYR